jgi:hypothetical protein
MLAIGSFVMWVRLLSNWHIESCCCNMLDISMDDLRTSFPATSYKQTRFGFSLYSFVIVLYDIDTVANAHGMRFVVMLVHVLLHGSPARSNEQL